MGRTLRRSGSTRRRHQPTLPCKSRSSFSREEKRHPSLKSRRSYQLRKQFEVKNKEIVRAKNVKVNSSKYVGRHGQLSSNQGRHVEKVQLKPLVVCVQRLSAPVLRILSQYGSICAYNVNRDSRGSLCQPSTSVQNSSSSRRLRSTRVQPVVRPNVMDQLRELNADWRGSSYPLRSSPILSQPEVPEVSDNTDLNMKNLFLENLLMCKKSSGDRTAKENMAVPEKKVKSPSDKSTKENLSSPGQDCNISVPGSVHHKGKTTPKKPPSDNVNDSFTLMLKNLPIRAESVTIGSKPPPLQVKRKPPPLQVKRKPPTRCLQNVPATTNTTAPKPKRYRSLLKNTGPSTRKKSLELNSTAPQTQLESPQQKSALDPKSLAVKSSLKDKSQATSSTQSKVLVEIPNRPVELPQLPVSKRLRINSSVSEEKVAQVANRADESNTSKRFVPFSQHRSSPKAPELIEKPKVNRRKQCLTTCHDSESLDLEIEPVIITGPPRKLVEKGVKKSSKRVRGAVDVPVSARSGAWIVYDGASSKKLKENVTKPSVPVTKGKQEKVDLPTHKNSVGNECIFTIVVSDSSDDEHSHVIEEQLNGLVGAKERKSCRESPVKSSEIQTPVIPKDRIDPKTCSNKGKSSIKTSETKTSCQAQTRKSLQSKIDQKRGNKKMKSFLGINASKRSENGQTRDLGNDVSPTMSGSSELPRRTRSQGNQVRKIKGCSSCPGCRNSTPQKQHQKAVPASKKVKPKQLSVCAVGSQVSKEKSNPTILDSPEKSIPLKPSPLLPIVERDTGSEVTLGLTPCEDFPNVDSDKKLLCGSKKSRRTVKVVNKKDEGRNAEYPEKGKLGRTVVVNPSENPVIVQIILEDDDTDLLVDQPVTRTADVPKSLCSLIEKETNSTGSSDSLENHNPPPPKDKGLHPLKKTGSESSNISSDLPVNSLNGTERFLPSELCVESVKAAQVSVNDHDVVLCKAKDELPSTMVANTSSTGNLKTGARKLNDSSPIVKNDLCCLEKLNPNLRPHQPSPLIGGDTNVALNNKSSGVRKRMRSTFEVENKKGNGNSAGYPEKGSKVLTTTGNASNNLPVNGKVTVVDDDPDFPATQTAGIPKLGHSSDVKLNSAVTSNSRESINSPTVEDDRFHLQGKTCSESSKLASDLPGVTSPQKTKQHVTMEPCVKSAKATQMPTNIKPAFSKAKDGLPVKMAGNTSSSSSCDTDVKKLDACAADKSCKPDSFSRSCNVSLVHSDSQNESSLFNSSDGNLMSCNVDVPSFESHKKRKDKPVASRKRSKLLRVSLAKETAYVLIQCDGETDRKVPSCAAPSMDAISSGSERLLEGLVKSLQENASQGKDPAKDCHRAQRSTCHDNGHGTPKVPEMTGWGHMNEMDVLQDILAPSVTTVSGDSLTTRGDSPQESLALRVTSQDTSKGSPALTEAQISVGATDQSTSDMDHLLESVTLNHLELAVENIEPESTTETPANDASVQKDGLASLEDSLSVIQAPNLPISLNHQLTIKKSERLPQEETTTAQAMLAQQNADWQHSKDVAACTNEQTSEKAPSSSNLSTPDNSPHKRRSYPTPIKHLNPDVLTVRKFNDLVIDDDEPSLNEPLEPDLVECISSNGTRFEIQPDKLSSIQEILRTKPLDACSEHINNMSGSSLEGNIVDDLVIDNEAPPLNSTPIKNPKSQLVLEGDEDLEDLVIDNDAPPLYESDDADLGVKGASQNADPDCLVISSDDEGELPESSRLPTLVTQPGLSIPPVLPEERPSRKKPLRKRHRSKESAALNSKAPVDLVTPINQLELRIDEQPKSSKAVDFDFSELDFLADEMIDEVILNDECSRSGGSTRRSSGAFPSFGEILNQPQVFNLQGQPLLKFDAPVHPNDARPSVADSAKEKSNAVPFSGALPSFQDTFDLSLSLGGSSEISSLDLSSSDTFPKSGSDSELIMISPQSNKHGSSNVNSDCVNTYKYSDGEAIAQTRVCETEDNDVIMVDTPEASLSVCDQPDVPNIGASVSKQPIECIDLSALESEEGTVRNDVSLPMQISSSQVSAVQNADGGIYYVLVVQPGAEQLFPPS